MFDEILGPYKPKVKDEECAEECLAEGLGDPAEDVAVRRPAPTRVPKQNTVPVKSLAGQPKTAPRQWNTGNSGGVAKRPWRT